MAQNIVIAGATFNAVPSITCNKSGGGTASFVDTSDANATAEDILQDKSAYVNGVKIVGTGSGGGGASSKYGIGIDDLLGDVSSDTLNVPTGGNVDLTISGFKKLAQYALYYKFVRNTRIKSVTFSDLEQAATSYAMQYAFYYCTSIQTADFSKLTTINGSSAFGNVFYGCSALKTVDLSALETVNTSSCMQYAFYNCSNLESIDFSALKTIGSSSTASANNRHFYYAFNGCTKLTELRFPELTAIYCNGNGTTYGSFANNTKVKKLYFPKLTTMTWSSAYTNANKAQPIENMFYGCTDLTEIHFALTNKTAVESITGYSTKWAAPANCSILFDL